MKLAGIDFGEKRVGLALSDDSGALAFPKGILANDSEIIEKLLKIITEEKVEKIIFGLSQNAQGEDNPVMKKGREFAGELQKIFSRRNGVDWNKIRFCYKHGTAPNDEHGEPSYDFGRKHR